MADAPPQRPGSRDRYADLLAFQKTLRLARIAAERDQGPVAKAIGVSQGLLSAWELRRTPCPDTRLNVWAAFLQVSIPEGLRGTVPRPVAEHGTGSGYDRHLRERTPPCAPCRAANTAEQRANRARRAGGARLESQA